MQQPLREENESLWWLVAPMLIWAAHLLGSYCTAAIACEKLVGRNGSLTAVRLAIAVYSLLALAALAGVGLRGYRRQRFGAGGVRTQHLDTPEDRHRFLGFSTALLAALAAVAVFYQGLPALFIGSCR